MFLLVIVSNVALLCAAANVNEASIVKSSVMPITEQPSNMPVTMISSDMPIIEKSSNMPMTMISSDMPITEKSSNMPMTMTSSNMPITEQSSNMPMNEKSSNMPMTMISSVKPITDKSSNMSMTMTSSDMPSTKSSAMPITVKSSTMQMTMKSSAMQVTEKSSTMSISETSSDMPTTMESSTLLTTEKPSAMPITCPNGFVRCVDGQCEPFEALCGEGGIVTVTFPTDETTVGEFKGSTKPVVGGSTIDSSGAPAVAVATNTVAVTTPTILVTTTPVVIATDSNGREICLDGWELCMDGTCEPFHWLCEEHDGSANFTTVKTTQAPSTKAVETDPPAVTDITMKTITPSVSVVQTITPDAVTETVVTEKSPQEVSAPLVSIQSTGVPNLSGTCPKGFVQCVDGTCESFEALCGEGGVVTVTFQTDMPTAGTIPLVSGSPVPDMSTSEILTTSTTVPTTTTFAVATDSNGKEVCADGWEQCKDGTCEPFHWLCTEHDGTVAIIG